MDKFKLLEIKTQIEKVARKGGRILKSGLNEAHTVMFKGVVDLVTEMDCKVEKTIVDTIEMIYPDHEIYSEEQGKGGITSSIKWVIDPLDGTTNYAHGYTHFCISIALQENDELLLAIIFDPIKDEMFTAVAGNGTFLNDKPVFVSKEPLLDKSLVATGFPYDRRTSSDNNLKEFQNFIVKVQGIRRSGSAALDLAYVACGRLDGFWEPKLQPWDVAAGSLLVKEAGGIITDYSGNEFKIDNQMCLASNGKIHSQMKEVLKECRY